MPGPKPRLHLPYGQWPAADRLLWERAMGSDDILSPMQPVLAWPRPRSMTICSHGGGSSGSWRSTSPPHWRSLPTERLTIERVRPFVAHLAETNIPQSVATQVDALYKAARVMMPERDWTWLKAVKARLYRAAPAHAPSGPVITSVQLLDLGLATDGREQTNTGHSDQHGRRRPLPRRLDDRAPRLYPAPA